MRSVALLSGDGNRSSDDVFMGTDSSCYDMANGPDSVHEIIVESGWSYPVTARRLETSRPMANIIIDEKGNSMMLPELLHKADVERFDSREDLEQKLGPVCEAESKERHLGILGRLKQTFLG